MPLDHRSSETAASGVYFDVGTCKTKWVRHFSTMSLTVDFVGGLVRDANRMEHLDAFQKRRALERAVAMIAQLRGAVGIPTGPGRDITLDIHATALSIERGWRDDSQVRDAFLLAAGIIRDLQIVLDSKTGVSVVANRNVSL